MLQATQTSTAVWPIPGDGPDLQAIVWAGMATIKNNAALIDAYQTVLNNAQAIPNATGTITNSPSPGTTIGVTGIVGIIKIGSTVTGTGIPANTIVVSQQSGTAGGAGNYTISNPGTASAAAATFSPGGGNPPWPAATDSDDLMLITQDQAAIIRTQTALLQQLQDLLNVSQTPAPPSGP